ncbi:hypothetical protein RFI_17174, partial [Reticulomyxa filosa]
KKKKKKKFLKKKKKKLDELRKQSKTITYAPPPGIMKASNSKDSRDDGDSAKPRETASEAKAKTKEQENISLITDVKLVKKLHDMKEMEPIKDDDNIMTLLKKEQNRDTLDYQYELLHTHGGKKLLETTNTDDQFDTIDEHQLFQDTNTNRKRKLESKSEEAQRSRKRQRLVALHSKEMEMLNKCKYCLENDICKEKIQHLIVTIGKYFYVCVMPERSPLHRFCCLIVPMEHVCSIRSGLAQMSEQYTSAQEEEFRAELFHIQNSLTIFYLKQFHCGTVFLETCKHLRKQQLQKKYHSHIIVVPVTKDHGLFDALPRFLSMKSSTRISCGQ